jgi:protein required for attachment to host cells
MMMATQRTWMVVADGARARVFHARLGDHTLELVHETDQPAARQKTSEIMSDRAGRMWDPGPGQRSGMELPTDPQRHAKETFARDLAEWLDSAAKEGRYDRLVLIAAPQTLGDLRAHLPQHAAGRVWRELDKDLTQLDAKALAERLDDLVRD